MYKIKCNVDLGILPLYEFKKINKWGTEVYEKWYKSIGYQIRKDRSIHKYKDIGWYTIERKVNKQDIDRLEINNLVEKEED